MENIKKIQSGILEALNKQRKRPFRALEIFCAKNNLSHAREKRKIPKKILRYLTYSEIELMVHINGHKLTFLRKGFLFLKWKQV